MISREEQQISRKIVYLQIRNQKLQEKIQKREQEIQNYMNELKFLQEKRQKFWGYKKVKAQKEYETIIEV